MVMYFTTLQQIWIKFCASLSPSHFTFSQLRQLQTSAGFAASHLYSAPFPSSHCCCRSPLPSRVQSCTVPFHCCTPSPQSSAPVQTGADWMI